MAKYLKSMKSINYCDEKGKGDPMRGAGGG